jgi:hypothetical protein
MALKKGILDSYIKERETPKTSAQPTQHNKYSHNRVFDEPESLKKAINNTVQAADKNEDTVSPLNLASNDIDITQKNEIKPDKKANKPITKPVTKPVTNGTQTRDERYTNIPQDVNIPVFTDHKRLTKAVTNGSRMVHNSLPQSVLPKLTGIQRYIIIAIYRNCRINGGNVTQELTLDYIASLTSVNKKSIKTSINRLKNKSCITVADYKDGRGGWVKYKISQQLFTELLQHEGLLFPNANLAQMVNKPVTQPITEPITNFPSSSSNDIKTTTTDLPHEWKKIDFTPLAKINFGMTELKNIYRKCPEHINHEIVQDSIDQFAFGLANNSERYKSMNAPSGILVKALSEGTSWIESGYISPEEVMKKEKERKLAKLLEQQFKEPKFLEWFNVLDEYGKENLVPHGVKSSTSYMISKAVIQKDHARKHFEHEIWPAILANLKVELI